MKRPGPFPAIQHPSQGPARETVRGEKPSVGVVDPRVDSQRQSRQLGARSVDGIATPASPMFPLSRLSSYLFARSRSTALVPDLERHRPTRSRLCAALSRVAPITAPLSLTPAIGEWQPTPPTAFTRLRGSCKPTTTLLPVDKLRFSLSPPRPRPSVP